MDPTRLGAAGAAGDPIAQTALTPDQKEALARLHTASQQFEGVFLGMLMKSMSDTVPKNGIFGKQSSSETMWAGMLDEQRANAIATTGSLGIAKILENQLKASVLGNASTEAKAPIIKGFEP